MNNYNSESVGVPAGIVKYLFPLYDELLNVSAC